MLIPDDLKRLCRAGRLIPFVGAGVSQSVQWKEGGEDRHGISWKELVDGAAKILGFDMPDLLRVRGTDLQILEYFRIRKNAAFLTNWLTSQMRPPDDALLSSRIHNALAKLDQCSVFYTTNFDDFLERSFSLFGHKIKVIAGEEDMGPPNKEKEIIKFHGDFNHPAQMVLSERDYERRLAFNSPMDLRLRSDMLGRAILFIGYSFRDSNVAYLFRLVHEQLQSLPATTSGHRAYILVPDPSDFENQLFAARKLYVLPIEGNKITEQTADFLSELGG